MLSSSLKDNIEIYKLLPKLIPPRPTMVERQFDAPDGATQKQLEADAVLASFYLFRKRPDVKEIRTKFFANGKLVYELTAPQFQAKKLWEAATVSKTTERQDWIASAGSICQKLGCQYYPEGKSFEPTPPPKEQSELRAVAAEVVTKAAWQLFVCSLSAYESQD